jgi:hypothetical protein
MRRGPGEGTHVSQIERPFFIVLEFLIGGPGPQRPGFLLDPGSQPPVINCAKGPHFQIFNFSFEQINIEKSLLRITQLRNFNLTKKEKQSRRAKRLKNRKSRT